MQSSSPHNGFPYGQHPFRSQFPALANPMFYSNPQVGPQLPHHQPSTVYGRILSDRFVSASDSGYPPPATPSFGTATLSSINQPVLVSAQQEGSPVQQPAHRGNDVQTPPSRHSKPSESVEGSMAGSPHGKMMKHLTCYYWAAFGNCKHKEENCFYSHRHEGCDGVASKPIHKEPGKPAVAGKNANKEEPEYVNWERVHALTNPPAPKAPLHPKVQEQLKAIKKKHDVPLSNDPHVRALQLAEQRTIEQRAIEAAGAAEQHERLEARIMALDELMERLGAQQTSPDITFATTNTDPCKRSSSDPTLSPQLKKERLSDTETSMAPAIDTTSVMADLVAENQAMRTAVQDMAGVVSTVMTANTTMRANRSQLHDSMWDKILKTSDPEDKKRLFQAFANSAQGLEETRGAEEKAKNAVEAVRQKMVELGQGGLLTAWDRDFCQST
ncbi:MAG: hypothetical protein Q9166_002826 [cf. Caloplaca sp. 2 TL-2023]